MRRYRCSSCAHPAFLDRPRCRRCGAENGLVVEEFRLHRGGARRDAAVSCAAARRDAQLEFCRAVQRHFRRESGHYYWQVLVGDDPIRLQAFRERFGDERRDYAEALRAHYHDGPPADWQAQFVSPYASAHPWEDFAETWSYYLHLIGLAATGNARDPALAGYAEREVLALAGRAARAVGFRALLRRWLPASLRASRRSRRQGRAVSFRLAPPPPVIEKMAWIHRLVQESIASMQPMPVARLA